MLLSDNAEYIVYEAEAWLKGDDSPNSQVYDLGIQTLSQLLVAVSAHVRNSCFGINAKAECCTDHDQPDPVSTAFIKS